MIGVFSTSREMTVVVLAASIGLWSLAARVPVADRSVCEDLIVGALGLSAAIGLVQVMAQPTSGWIATYYGRATGLTPHPVYFGALMAAGAVLVASRLVVGRWWWGALLALFAAAISASGTRVAFGASLVGLALVVRSSPGRRLVLCGPPFAVGICIGMLSTRPASNSSTTAVSAVGRLSDSGGALSERIDVWGFGLEAFLEKPVFGWGLGNFRSATQGHYSLEFARSVSDRSPWFDAHNLIVELLVAVGPVGLGLFAAFGVLAGYRSRGPSAIASMTIALTWLLEPVSLSTLPLALILLGLSSTPAASISWPFVSSRLAAGALAVGSAAALFVGARDVAFKEALRTDDAAKVESVASWFWRDPIVADAVAQSWQIDYIYAPSQHAEERAITWSQRVTDYEPLRPTWWDRLGTRLYFHGKDEAARASFEQAVSLQPLRASTWSYLLDIADEEGDVNLEQRAVLTLCLLDSDRCRLP
ncbi:O-antigen ligase-like membrane protein [Ilumatobacter fluminis]|uniref:O-antigen ligase-like membrane protein n=2 Tax=Ilumatobacter fluminis TaxID=467091 RepID=A0A4R7I4A6_9ACTN|nr:O-antigen ligase-like membrane protein [Ilumatobacter fluminis]